MTRRITAHPTGKFTRATGAADRTAGYNSALVDMQCMIGVNYGDDPTARKIHAAIGKMHMTGDTRQPGDPTQSTAVHMFSVRRHNGLDDSEGESIGVYGTLAEAQQVAETHNAVTFVVWQV